MKTTTAPSIKEMLTAGVHLGHLRRFSNSKMKPYVYGLKNQLQIIDLDKSRNYYQQALEFVAKIANRNGKVLFVGTKKAAKQIIKEEATRCGMPYVDQHWLGGMLTNYKTIKKSIKRIDEMSKLLSSAKSKFLTKKERLTLERELAKLELTLGGFKNIAGLPDALFVVDVGYEKTAVKEAQRLKIPVIGIVDTNTEPEGVDFMIPGNDDAKRAIRLYASSVANVINGIMAEKKAEASAKFGDDYVEIKDEKPKQNKKTTKVINIKQGKTSTQELEVAEKKESKAKASKATKSTATKKAATKKETATKTASTTKAGQISAASVKELRHKTSAGMMECKKALTEANGDIEQAVELLRKSGQAKAVKKASRLAAEGVIAVANNNDGKTVAIIELNSETDFVAKQQSFQDYAQTVASLVLQSKETSLENINSLKADSGKTLEELRLELVSSLGENINI